MEVKGTQARSAASVRNQAEENNNQPGTPENGDPGIFVPPPFDPDLGPGFNPIFDGEFASGLTSHNFVNLMFDLVNMFAETLFNGFGDTPASGGDGSTGGAPEVPGVPGSGGDGSTGGDTITDRGGDRPTSPGLPPLFGNPGDGNTFQGDPGVGGSFPVPPPYDPNIGPPFNPVFDGTYAWDLTSNTYLNLLLRGVNDFDTGIRSFPTQTPGAA